MLRRALGGRIGHVGVPRALLLKLWGAGLAAGLTGLGIKLALARALGTMPGVEGEWGGRLLAPPHLHPILLFLAVVLPFGAVYFGVTGALGIPEAKAVFQRLLRRRAAR
jgi:putative peptidoglycan lipid II flippase